MEKGNIILKEKILSEYGTLNSFAEILGISTNMLLKKLNGENSFRLHEIQAIANLLHIKSPYELERCFSNVFNENKNLMKNLFNEMLIRRISPADISKQLKITTNTLFNKIIGNSDFNWREACYIQSAYFPDLSKDMLFKRSCTI